jgi:hypothetical protein
MNPTIKFVEAGTNAVTHGRTNPSRHRRLPTIPSFFFFSELLNVVAPPLDITPEAIKVVTTILMTRKIWR